MKATLLVQHIDRLYTLSNLGPAVPHRELHDRVEASAQSDAAVAFQGDQVVYVGPTAHAPPAAQVVDATGHLGLPGLVDPHTHAVWAGDRSHEFALRLRGRSYTEILEGGGGILSTVEATRRATSAELSLALRPRLQRLLEQGVTTVEVKSGYGLEPATERRMLEVVCSPGHPTATVGTFLGAHAIPREHRTQRDAYVRQVIDEQLPLAVGLATHVDVYCDRGAFDLDEACAILQAGRALGFALRAHAEQVEHTGIARAAAELGATCVDHLERVDEAGIAAMAAADTVAVLLPGAQLYLHDSSPPVPALREAGVRMAVGTDLNPGSSPVPDLWTALALACVLQGLTVDEAVVGATRHAGAALGRPDLGWLGPGSRSDLALFPSPGTGGLAALVQPLGARPASGVVREGRWCHGALAHPLRSG